MSPASQNETAGAAGPSWIKVPIKRPGFLGAVVVFLEYFGYFFVTALSLFVAWSQLTGQLGASSHTHRQPAWYDGPAGLLVSLPLALACGIPLLIGALDVLTPAVIFEGEVTELRLKNTRGPRIAIRDWFICCGGLQAWRIQATDAPDLRQWIDAGKKVRITHTSTGRKVLRLEVATATAPA